MGLLYVQFECKSFLKIVLYLRGPKDLVFWAELRVDDKLRVGGI